MHRYLSTACLHAVDPGQEHLHDYCKKDTGLAGSKTPARCKFCGAHCVCPCHRIAAARAEHRAILDKQGELIRRLRQELV